MCMPAKSKLKQIRSFCRISRIALIILLFTAMSCRPKEHPKIVSQKAETSVDTPEDFQEFYIAFHTDSAYQLAHILFPLDGFPAADERNDNDFKWQKEDWKLHNLDHFDPDKFSVRRDIVDSTLITEYIQDEKTGFGIKRRFAKFDNEWFLIYYSAMNPGEGS